ncbi:VanZ family protein [Nitrosovibrio sp. Nv17]|uniref:VanZ family protein n=1 Tax=Nitrosovibrio sp. Nv17 TaxID=1855339 RepID=UPI000908B4A5|nr:VanZ family protein [Nitrosovibrio sp. Nv17]SFW20248.1 VanZ like family protein [Nitrosovibrio sp. Nv17]
MRILLAILALIAYGSLYPGDFAPPEPGALRQFLTDWSLFTTQGDLLGNIALFFPLGAACMLLRPDWMKDSVHTFLLGLFALTYSFALQLAQVWLPTRTAGLADVLWNMTGLLLGMGVAHAIGRYRPKLAHIPGAGASAPLWILLLWLLTELLPLVPTLDWQKFKDALKPLLLGFEFSFSAALMHAAGVMIAGIALAALGRRPAWWLGGVLACVGMGKLIIIHLAVDGSFFVGSLAGYTGFLATSRSDRTRPPASAFWLLLAAWSIAALSPFSIAPAGSFNGIPFATMLRGSMEVGARGLTQSLFVYTALLWLLHRMGTGFARATGGLMAGSFIIELLQMGMLGRTADVTEPLLVLLVGWALSRMHRPGIPSAQAIDSPAPAHGTAAHMREDRISARQVLAIMAAGVALCTAVGWLVARSPWVPYNVRELVYSGHPFRSLVLLAILAYWAAGFTILIVRRLSRGEAYLLGLPPLVLLHGLGAWLLLWLAVPDESFHDIVGSPILDWPWKWEVLGRFLAVFGFYSVAATGGTIAAARHALPGRGAWTAMLGWTIGACLLLPVFYYVMVMAAATDNVVELIAGNGSVTGFLLIGLAMAGIAFGGTSVALGLMPTTGARGAALAGTLVSGMLVYLALHLGTEQVIVKYGRVFSALQFLLSSDRTQLATTEELILRYLTLWSALVATIAMVQYPLWRRSLPARPGTEVGRISPAA